LFGRQVLPASGTTPALAQSPTIYLNHNGATLRPGYNDSRQNLSSIVSAQVAMPAWATSAQNWTDTVNCFKDVWSRFGVTVTDVDPGNVPHIEALFSGTPGLVGLPANVGGVSPFTLDCSIIENSIVFTFSAILPNDARLNCEIMAQEVAHSYGLDHELLASDPMTYLAYNGNRAFRSDGVVRRIDHAAVWDQRQHVPREPESSSPVSASAWAWAHNIAPTVDFASPADGDRRARREVPRARPTTPR
jgi:hypothetical protein